MAEMKMNRAVMVGPEKFAPGQEEELDEALTKTQVKRLKSRRVIEGDFTGKFPEDEKRKPARGAGTDEFQDPTERASQAGRKRREKLRAAAKARSPKEEKNEEPTFVLDHEGDTLTDEFPGVSELQEAGFSTVGDVKANLDHIEDVDGIGPAKAKQIREHLA